MISEFIDIDKFGVMSPVNHKKYSLPVEFVFLVLTSSSKSVFPNIVSDAK